MKIFIVYTTHTDWDEYNPYIVLAENEEQAKELVISSGDFGGDESSRVRWHNLEDYPGRIEKVEEMPLNEAKVVWAVFNPG